MKNSFYLLLVSSLIVFSACSEGEEVDPRNAFVGDWSETYSATYTFDGESYHDNGLSSITISKGNQPHEILMIEEGQVVKATVDGNSFRIPRQTIYEEIDGIEYIYEYAGHGELSGNKIEYSFTMKEISGLNISISVAVTASRITDASIRNEVSSRIMRNGRVGRTN